MTGDEDRHGRDKEDPRTPAPLTETRKPGARPKVNRKLYPDLPTQDGSQDSWSTGSTKGKRETGPGDGIRDVRSNAGKESSDKDQNPSISPQIYVSPSSRHPKKDPSPDERSDETSASKASSGVSSGVHMWYKEKIAAGLDGSKLNSTPDILYEENKQIYDMSWSTSDFEHPTPMETESVPDYPTPMETESTPFQRDNLADSTASSPNDSIDDGHVRLFTSNFRGSSCTGLANRLPNPPASACLPAHLSKNQQENPNRGSSSSSSAPLKKDGSPDMRYKENKIAAGLHGYKKDGTPDRRFKENH
ncbi:uncharacterized protein LOC118421618 [Branchiostoma floridae]|uniref:Uncharacterized protein LOC118421618 n=1 Tax=Branchiostoma floridae TaxID=7739 RepID=A0A9J7N005_BRAFL|nr:uncharacterized protein LOC118421618 [Branchiostoma floridae]